jgi:hypothetical protein
MMNKAKGPVWHKKQKDQGIIPEGLTGIDKEATWGKSNADGWVYGHGTFSIVEHKHKILCQFKWMPNSADDSKVMHEEAKGLPIRKVCMDSKADSQDLYFDLKDNYQIQLLTRPRKKIKSENRRKMYQQILTKRNIQIYKVRSKSVEPVQGLIKDIFDLDVCWMRGNDNNGWLFAAMGIAIQIAQWNAHLEGRSIWAIKNYVLGI